MLPFIIADIGEDIKQGLAWRPARAPRSRGLEFVKEEEIGPGVVEARHPWRRQLRERLPIGIDEFGICVDRVSFDELGELPRRDSHQQPLFAVLLPTSHFLLPGQDSQ